MSHKPLLSVAIIESIGLIIESKKYLHKKKGAICAFLSQFVTVSPLITLTRMINMLLINIIFEGPIICDSLYLNVSKTQKVNTFVI